ncbi:MAG: VWA domain-containing protein [Rudaea sp.]
MFEWAWPWFAVLLPLPWIVSRLLKPAHSESVSALRVPLALQELAIAEGAAPVPTWRALAALLAWVLIVFAATRPQWLGDAESLPRTGRDLLLAVDASGSMSTEDMTISARAVSRYGAVKTIAGDFIHRRIGDRIGLIVFGSQAYMLTPLTFDRDTVLKQLDDSVVGLPGRQTAIGDAVGLAVKRLHSRPQDHRVLILLTDGVNDAGELDPYKSIDLAIAEHVKIYTIGIGANSMRIDDFFGGHTVNPSADLDERLLKTMAENTGGSFFRARDTSELANIYREIDKLEPAADAQQQFRPVDELFYWPLSAALLLIAVMTLADRVRANRLLTVAVR